MKLKDDRPRCSVFLYIFNRNFSKILLIKRNEEKRKKWGFDWGTIGGKIEPEETSIDACLREAKEEIGLDFLKNNLRFVFIKEIPSKNRDLIVHFFYLVQIKESSKLIINSESDSFEWFEIKNLPKSMIDAKEHILKILEVSQKNC